MKVSIHIRPAVIAFNWLLSTCFLWLGAPLATAQPLPREERLRQLERQLTAFPDSLVPGLTETASFTVSNAPIGEFLRGLAQTHRLNVSLDPQLDIRVTNNFTGVPVRELLLFICREHGLDIRITGNIFHFFRYQAPPEIKLIPPTRAPRLQYDPSGDRLTADLSGDSLSVVARQLTQISKKNVLFSPGLQGKVLSGYVEGLPFEAGLDKLAYANGLRLLKTQDNAFLLESAEASAGTKNRTNQVITASAAQRPAGGPASNASPGEFSLRVQAGADGKKLLDLDAENTPLLEIVNEASLRLGVNYVLFSPLPGSTTAHLTGISYEDLLSYLTQGTPHTVRKNGNVYLIGERITEGFRQTRLVKMQYRPAEKLDEVIPAELKKGVEIKIFKELNGLVLSGGEPQLEEIDRFLRAIDQPVLNVLIEVIVMEVNKSHSVETGISAILSDSTVRTGGTVFPGVDLTLGSNGINDLLRRLENWNLIKIGRVTPNFYLSLKALEQNNYVKVRSTPKLSTLNGHEANLTIGQSVYYLEQTQNITGGVTPINSVSQQFKKVDANLTIKINPMVSGDEHITLDIAAEFSDFIAPVIPGAPPGNATRKFTSMIRVKNEEMIILGGLEEARKTNGGSGVPVLSRIPVLKWLFSSRRSEMRNNRLLVFIRPTLVY